MNVHQWSAHPNVCITNLVFAAFKTGSNKCHICIDHQLAKLMPMCVMCWPYRRTGVIFRTFFCYIFTSHDRFNVKVAEIHEKIMILPFECNTGSLIQQNTVYMFIFSDFPNKLICPFTLSVFPHIHYDSNHSNQFCYL